MNRGRIRSVRSDKKVDCKPTISINLKECIYRLSYITNMPVKDIGELICRSGINSKIVINHLSNHFRRDFKLKNTVYLGDLNRKSLQKNRGTEKKERITIRFYQYDYEKIKELAYALDVTPSRATALLLEASIYQTDFINHFMKAYVKEQLDEGRVRELKKVIDFINRNSPYEEKISWVALFSFLYDELKTGIHTMTNALNNWIDKMR